MYGFPPVFSPRETMQFQKKRGEETEPIKVHHSVLCIFTLFVIVHESLHKTAESTETACL